MCNHPRSGCSRFRLDVTIWLSRFILRECRHSREINFELAARTSRARVLARLRDNANSAVNVAQIPVFGSEAARILREMNKLGAAGRLSFLLCLSYRATVGNIKKVEERAEITRARRAQMPRGRA